MSSYDVQLKFTINQINILYQGIDRFETFQCMFGK